MTWKTDQEVQAFDRARDEAMKLNTYYERYKLIWERAREFSEAEKAS